MGTSAVAVKSALVSTLRTLFPAPVLVTYGAPGNNQPDDVIAVLDQQLDLERMPLGTARRREETLRTQVVVSVFRGGDGPATQQTATERAWAIHDALDAHVRTSPNETLGGACRDCWVESADLVESRIDSPDGGGLILGHAADLTLTVVTTARI